MTSMEDSNNHIMEGYILFLPFAEGSKSEGLRPFLVNSSQGVKMLYRKEDNPFENTSLRPFHTKYCRVKGNAGQAGVFLVDSIEELANRLP
jgi:hypothetical protein